MRLRLGTYGVTIPKEQEGKRGGKLSGLGGGGQNGLGRPGFIRQLRIPSEIGMPRKNKRVGNVENGRGEHYILVTGEYGRGPRLGKFT